MRLALQSFRTVLLLSRRILPQRTRRISHNDINSLRKISLSRALSTSKCFYDEKNNEADINTPEDVEKAGITKSRWAEVPIEQITLKEIGLMTKDEQIHIADRWFESLTSEQKKYYDLMKMEYDVMLSTGHHVPRQMEMYMWMKICMDPSYANRRRTYKYLAIVEQQGLKAEKKRLKKREHLESLPKTEYRDEDGGFHYTTFRRNSFLQRIERPMMNRFYYNNIYNALLWGQKLVFDFDYDDIMRPRDITNMIDQFLESHGHNRVHRDPFYFYVCNASPDSASVQRLYRSASGIDEYPFTVTEKSYLDIFPRDKLVYLSPNAPAMLEDYNHDDVYIVGGLVDKIVCQPVTMAKAKREGIRMAKLPIDLYYRFVSGSKSLSLDQITRILLDMKDTGDWTTALRHIPKRKVIPMSEIREEERRRDERRAEAMRKRATRNRRSNYHY
ncbi:uncharacterized protein LOC141903840 [Tubulanus polymorphus]|uniref:uncharacterized protein LOC141903840 n=1 Tax=Tubulanus polymorphus TaxID=672921 RepID=UPI003DA4B9AA